jgi:hypothetical protein
MPEVGFTGQAAALDRFIKSLGFFSVKPKLNMDISVSHKTSPFLRSLFQGGIRGISP